MPFTMQNCFRRPSFNNLVFNLNFVINPWLSRLSHLKRQLYHFPVYYDLFHTKKYTIWPQIFSAIDRSNLLDDAFNLARATLLDYPTALGLTTYMSKEMDYFPWRTASSALNYINNQLYGEEDYYLWRVRRCPRSFFQPRMKNIEKGIWHSSGLFMALCILSYARYDDAYKSSSIHSPWLPNLLMTGCFPALCAWVERECDGEAWSQRRRSWTSG